MKNNQYILVGLLGGITAGIMMYAAVRSGGGVSVLICLSPAAIYLSSMGWGAVSGFIAAIVATMISTFVGSSGFAIVSALMIFMPAAWVGHLTNLGETDAENDITYWYPLGRILFQLAILLAAGVICSALILRYSEDTIIAELSKQLTLIMEASQSTQQLTSEQIQSSAEFYVSLIPVLLPPLWLIMHVIVAILCAKITNKSEKLARPIDDIAATVVLPTVAMGVLLAGIIGSLIFDGTLAQIAKVILGLAVMAFALIGLADMHLKTRGKPSQTLILTAAYTLIVLFSIPLLFFCATGLFRTLAWNKKQLN